MCKFFFFSVFFMLYVSFCCSKEGYHLTHSKNTTTKPISHLLVKQREFQNQTGDSCDKNPKLRNLMIAIFCISVLVVGIVGNTIAIVVIVMSPSLLKQSAYLYIISLAIADLGVSFFVTTIKVSMHLHNSNFCHGIEACYFLTFVDLVFPIASVLHLLVIAVDRAMAICLPFRYLSYSAKRATKKIISAVWIYSAFWASLGMFPWRSSAKPLQVAEYATGRFCYILNMYYTTTVATVIYFVPMTITTILYVSILSIATRQAKAIYNLDPVKNKKQGRLFRRDMRALKTVSIVFTAYIICWLPHFVSILTYYWHLDAFNKFADHNPIIYDAMTTLFDNVLPVLNSCINPFIYFLSSNHFRIAFRILWRKLLGKPEHDRYRAESFLSERKHSSLTKKDSQTSVTVQETKIKCNRYRPSNV